MKWKVLWEGKGTGENTPIFKPSTARSSKKFVDAQGAVHDSPLGNEVLDSQSTAIHQ